MADGYNIPNLCNYYCANECPIGRQYVTEVEIKDLSQIVCLQVAYYCALSTAKGRGLRMIYFKKTEYTKKLLLKLLCFSIVLMNLSFNITNAYAADSYSGTIDFDTTDNIVEAGDTYYTGTIRMARYKVNDDYILVGTSSTDGVVIDDAGAGTNELMFGGHLSEATGSTIYFEGNETFSIASLLFYNWAGFGAAVVHKIEGFNGDTLVGAVNTSSLNDGATEIITLNFSNINKIVITRIPGEIPGGQTGFSVDNLVVTNVQEVSEEPAGNNTATASANSLTPVVGVNNEITLTVKDSASNTDTDFDGDKTVTITGYEAAPDATYGSFNETALEADGSTDVTVSFTNGVATANLKLNKANEQTIGFSIATVETSATNTLTITPTHGAAATMSVTQDITAPASNGGNFAQQPSITLKDAYGNTCTSDNATVVTAAKEDAGTWTLTGTTIATASSGVATFTNLGATNTDLVNNAQLGFTATGLGKVTSAMCTYLHQQM